MERDGRNACPGCKLIHCLLIFFLILFLCFIYLQNISQHAHIIATDLTVTYPRSLVIDFTPPFFNDPLVMVIPYPELDSTISGIVKPFQYEVGYNLLILRLNYTTTT